MKFKNRQITGNVGLFYICYKLSRMGWNVLPTSRNAKGIDILAYSEDGRTITIQAKGFTGTSALRFDKLTDVKAEYYVIATKTYQNHPITYILTKAEVSLNLTQHEDKYWLEVKDYRKNENLEQWDKIDFGFANKNEIEQIKKINSEKV